MLTFLIRTSYRPKQFARCIASIPVTANIIVSYDDARAVRYLSECKRNFKAWYVQPNQQPYYYNTYCNLLLELVKYDHCIFLDDDDTFINYPQGIEDGISYIVPFMRGNFEKPDLARRRQKLIQPGYIGLPCLILWHEHKKYINFEAREDADYQVIKHLSECVELQWLDTCVVSSEKRGWGAMEK